MRNLIMTVAAATLALPASALLPIDSAGARTPHTYHRGSYRHNYRNCRYSSGTTGLVAGGVGGALVGNSVIGHGALGPIAGAVGGAFAGRAIDRSMTAHRRCR